jgi:hypothetical protein
MKELEEDLSVSKSLLIKIKLTKIKKLPKFIKFLVKSFLTALETEIVLIFSTLESYDSINIYLLFIIEQFYL